jgi:transcriptional regulator with XRE-family HTH domain
VIVLGTNSIYLTLGKRIRYARDEKKMTQEELGKLVGLSRSFINHLETDRKKPSLETLIKLARVLNVSLDFLAEDDVKLVLRDLMPEEDQKRDTRTPYDVIIDRAIDYDVTPEELAIQLEAIRQLKGKTQSR